VAQRFGDLTETPVFFRTDDWRNILSNKLCALLRLEIKDFADLWIISKKKNFNWGRILDDARKKEMGLDPAVLASLMKNIPEKHFSAVKWINPPNWNTFKSDFDVITLDMVRGNDNSLCI